MTFEFNHVCFTVSDIDRSIQFYQKVFGLKIKEGPKDVRNPRTPVYTGVPGAHLRVALLQLYGDSYLELIQYLHPEGKKVVDDLRCDVGSTHIAFYAEDLPKCYEDLKAKGVLFVSPPMVGSKGLLMCYFYDPDGYTLELNELPKAE